MKKFDVVHHGTHATIEPHFCREIDCFGTNTDHGFTLEEACEQIAQWHEIEAQRWRSMTHYDAKYWQSESD